MSHGILGSMGRAHADETEDRGHHTNMSHLTDYLNKHKGFYKRLEVLSEHLIEVMMEDVAIHNEATNYAFKVNGIVLTEGQELSDDQSDLITLSQMDYYRMLVSKAIANLCQMSDPDQKDH